MQESNHQVLRTFARRFVDELDTCCLAFCERLCYVLYVEGYVVYTTATAVLLDELSNGRFLAGRFKEFDLYFTYLKEGSAYFLISYFLNALAFIGCEELKKGRGLLNRGDRNAQMFNVCGFHINDE